MDKVKNILYTSGCGQPLPADEPVQMDKKRAKIDERVVRRTLVRVWTKVLEHYARPGTPIPSVAEVRRELIEKGVMAASQAVADQYWFVTRWMVEDEIRSRVERELNQFDLDSFVRDVRAAQEHPERVDQLRRDLELHILT